MPKWDPINLTRHHSKHPGGKDKHCWQDLLGVNDRIVSEAEYEKESLAVCRDRWLEYEAEEVEVKWVAIARRRGEEVPFYPKRLHFVDDRLIKTIVIPKSNEIKTCFHEHFDRNHKVQGHNRPVGELRAKYNKHLDNLERSKMLRRFKRVHDES